MKTPVFDETSGRFYFPGYMVGRSFESYSEATMEARDVEFVAAAKAANEQIWNGINALISLQRQWNALDYGNTLAVDGVVAAEVGAVVFGTADAMAALLAAGHATNMAKLL